MNPMTQTDRNTTSTRPVHSVSTAEAISETVLLERCKSGDSAAWDALIRRYEKSVYKFAYSLCRNHEEAGDIAGQVFLRLYQNLHTFRNEASFTSWLFRIVRNTYLDLCVRPAHRGHLSLDASPTNDSEPTAGRDIMDPSPSPESLCMENETAQLLAKAIHHLPAYQRQVLRMYHTEGKSYEEIAEATGLVHRNRQVPPEPRPHHAARAAGPVPGNLHDGLMFAQREQKRRNKSRK